MDNKIDIKSLNLEELTGFIVKNGEKAFRAKQVYQWLHVKQVDTFDEMTNLSKAFREKEITVMEMVHSLFMVASLFH